jgi:hypothetical protein
MVQVLGNQNIGLMNINNNKNKKKIIPAKMGQEHGKDIKPVPITSQ